MAKNNLEHNTEEVFNFLDYPNLKCAYNPLGHVGLGLISNFCKL